MSNSHPVIVVVMRRFQLVHPVLQADDHPVLCQEHAHGDTVERDRPGRVGAAGELQPGGAEEVIERILVFLAQSPAKLSPAFHLLLDDHRECRYCSSHTTPGKDKIHRGDAEKILKVKKHQESY